LRQQAAMAIEANKIVRRALEGVDEPSDQQFDAAKHLSKNVQQMALLALKLQGNDVPPARSQRLAAEIPIDALEAIVASGEADGAYDATPRDEGDDAEAEP
jgi:hypothetical protein